MAAGKSVESTCPIKKKTSEPSSWNFGLQQVTIRNSKIKFISSQLSSDLKIEQAKIYKAKQLDAREHSPAGIRGSA